MEATSSNSTISGIPISLSQSLNLPSTSDSTSSSSLVTSRPIQLKRSRSQDSLSTISNFQFNSNDPLPNIQDSVAQASSSSSPSSKRQAQAQSGKSSEELNTPTFDIEAIAVELNCGICLELVHRPTTILPCLHSFCWSCIHSFLRPENPTKTSQNCPTCLQKVTLAKVNHSLDSLKQIMLKFDPGRERPSGEIHDANETFENWKVRSGTGEIRPAPVRYDDDQFIDEDDGFGAAGGGTGGANRRTIELVWPCLTCSPGNQSGFTCSHPIPAPGLLSIADFAPARGDRWASIESAAAIPHATHHAQCDSCSAWVPRHGPRSSYCALCLCHSCAPFEARGCPLPDPEVTLSLLHRAEMDECHVGNYFDNYGTPPGVAGVMGQILDYCEDNSFCLHEIVESIFQMAQEQLQIEEAEKASLEEQAPITVEMEVDPPAATEVDVAPASFSETTPRVVVAAERPGSAEAPANSTAPAAEAPAEVQEAAPRCVQFVTNRNEDGIRISREIKGEAAEALVNSRFCAECIPTVIGDFVLAWWKDVSKTLTVKREPCDLYAGDILYPSIAV